MIPAPAPPWTGWVDGEDGPVCVCGELTVVRITPDRQPVLTCLFHTREAGAVTWLALDKPGCFQSCDPDCEAGPAHCHWVHEPNHKPGWHSQADCPIRMRP
jgi:hypothetical protein